MTVHEFTTCEDETFYVVGVKVDSDVDGVSSQADKKDEGFVTIHINSRPTEMKVNKGAKFNVMPQETFKRLTTGEQPVKPNTATNLVACCQEQQYFLFWTPRTLSGRYSLTRHYRFLRMPFGINSTSEVFQHTMEQLFAGYPCSVIVNDIIIGGHRVDEHDANLKRVLERVREVNLKLNPAKCRFCLHQVGYVGHIFTSEGLKADPLKTEAITDMTVPTDVTSLQRFLGMVNYLGKYIPNFSDIAAPLRKLTHKETAWCWYQQHQKAFDRLKSCLSSAPVLAYYDVKAPVTLTCDASCYGLGAACMQNGRPVAYASRTLTDTETQYAQIERELLAVVFTCTKFKECIYGKPTIVEADHQPLVTILRKAIHTAPARLLRMLLQLQCYDISFGVQKG